MKEMKGKERGTKRKEDGGKAGRRDEEEGSGRRQDTETAVCEEERQEWKVRRKRGKICKGARGWN